MGAPIYAALNEKEITFTVRSRQTVHCGPLGFSFLELLRIEYNYYKLLLMSEAFKGDLDTSSDKLKPFSNQIYINIDNFSCFRMTLVNC